MSAWPPLKPLCLILKVFLQQRELNEVRYILLFSLQLHLCLAQVATILQVYTGGIGSYALLSMLIAMLRVRILVFQIGKVG